MKNIVITISRQYGSGGKTIGAMLAKDLGINCYSREILRMASEDSGINERLFGMSDEKIRHAGWFRILNRPYDGELLPPEDKGFTSDDNLFNYQAKIIKNLAAKESCVIVGRCADYVLQDYPNVMSVFIHADKKFCLDRSMERHSMTEKEMQKFIEKTDAYREIFTAIIPGMSGWTQETMTCVWTAESSDLKNVWRRSRRIRRFVLESKICVCRRDIL